MAGVLHRTKYWNCGRYVLTLLTLFVRWIIFCLLKWWIYQKQVKYLDIIGLCGISVENGSRRSCRLACLWHYCFKLDYQSEYRAYHDFRTWLNMFCTSVISPRRCDSLFPSLLFFSTRIFLSFLGDNSLSVVEIVMFYHHSFYCRQISSTLRPT